MDRVLGSQRPSEHVVEKGKELRDDLGLCLLRITDIGANSDSALLFADDLLPSPYFMLGHSETGDWIILIVR